MGTVRTVGALLRNTAAPTGSPLPRRHPTASTHQPTLMSSVCKSRAGFPIRRRSALRQPNSGNSAGDSHRHSHLKVRACLPGPKRRVVGNCARAVTITLNTYTRTTTARA